MLGMLDSSWVHLYMTLGLVGGAPTGRGSLVVVGEPAVWGAQWNLADVGAVG